MGRIQKKKTADKKRKKENGLDDHGTPRFVNETDGVLENTIPFAASSGEIRKKTAESEKRLFGGGIKDKNREENFLDRSVQFLREVRTELKRVTWPSRTQTMGSTAVVLVLTMIISLFLGMVDFSLSKLVSIVLG